MNLTDTDESKRELLQKSAAHRAAFEQDVQALSEKSEKLLINVVIVGGALTLAYLVVRKFGSSKKRSRKKSKLINTDEEPADSGRESKAATIMSDVGAVLATQATAFLLALAKEKLVEYLDAQTQKKKPAKHEYS